MSWWMTAGDIAGDECPSEEMWMGVESKMQMGSADEGFYADGETYGGNVMARCPAWLTNAWSSELEISGSEVLSQACRL